jgi:hypothetical protein
LKATATSFADDVSPKEKSVAALFFELIKARLTLLVLLTTLVGFSMSALGVKMAVYLTFPSSPVTGADRLLSVPLPTVRSASPKPTGASLKTIVTVAVSSTFSAVSDNSIVAVGALVSTE